MKCCVQVKKYYLNFSVCLDKTPDAHKKVQMSKSNFDHIFKPMGNKNITAYYSYQPHVKNHHTVICVMKNY